MAPKHWTIVLVPPDNETTRTFVVGARARRMAVAVVSAVGLLATSAIVVLFTPIASPGARLAAGENARLRAQLEQIDARLLALSDTLAAIGTHDQRLRIMAGMPVDSTIADASDTGTVLAAQHGIALASVTPMSLIPKPFVGRLGFDGHSDIEGIIRRAGDLSASFGSVSDSLARMLERLAKTPSIMPTTGWLSSHFSASRLHPVLHENRAHEGIDLSAPMGAPIIAPAAGVIRSVSYEDGYGRTFEIDHGNGIVTKFAHCSRIVVRAGQSVTRGQLIATVGNSGLSTGPHLHYEVHVNGRPVDPLKYVLPGKIAD
jgi:murein DD-endopeptidase MepM/ murein hydrolase activator NlpD